MSGFPGNNIKPSKKPVQNSKGSTPKYNAKGVVLFIETKTDETMLVRALDIHQAELFIKPIDRKAKIRLALPFELEEMQELKIQDIRERPLK